MLEYAGPQQLLAESDLVTLHVPLMPAPQRLIDATLQNALDYTAGRRSENVLVPRS